jgi:hypothetical protein
MMARRATLVEDPGKTFSDRSSAADLVLLPEMVYGIN